MKGQGLSSGFGCGTRHCFLETRCRETPLHPVLAAWTAPLGGGDEAGHGLSPSRGHDTCALVT